jgi:ABC-type transport system involved in multi-copper enzyme maturation permease subunit
MSIVRRERMQEHLRLLRLSARMLAGRWFWAWPVATIVWPLATIGFLVAGWRGEVTVDEAQNALIGIPMLVLAIAFGVQIIAGELDRRTLEIVYTVPGGSHRVWLYKLAAAVGLLIVAELLLAGVVWVFMTEFPLVALYGAFQSSVFCMVLAMGFSVLAKSEASGALLTGIYLTAIFLFFQRTRVSPFWNSEVFDTVDASTVFAWAVQNRIGFALATVAVTLLAFSRAEQRERILG